MLLFKDGLIECVLSRLQVFRGLMIAVFAVALSSSWCSLLPALKDGSGDRALKMWT